MSDDADAQQVTAENDESGMLEDDDEDMEVVRNLEFSGTRLCLSFVVIM